MCVFYVKLDMLFDDSETTEDSGVSVQVFWAQMYYDVQTLMRLRTAVAVLSQMWCWEQGGPDDIF